MHDYDLERRQAALRAIHLEQALRELPPKGDEPLWLKILGGLSLLAIWAVAVLIACL